MTTNSIASISILSHLVEESLDAVLIMDAACRIRYVNAAMEKLSGYMSGELIGESLNGLLPADVAAVHDAYVSGYIGSLRPSTILGRARELAIRHRTGELIPIELKAVDLGVEMGTHFFGAFMSDLRRRKAIETKNLALLAQLEQQALTDVLTELPNRRAFELEAERALALARREGWPVTVGIADIDRFKEINDRCGHAVGDRVLRSIARVVQSQVRAGDLCCRLGGEEFALLLPHATIAQATAVVERIRAAVANHAAENSSQGATTISIGIAQLDPAAPLESALASADAALYRAKRAGRNRVMVASN